MQAYEDTPTKGTNEYELLKRAKTPAQAEYAQKKIEERQASMAFVGAAMKNYTSERIPMGTSEDTNFLSVLGRGRTPGYESTAGAYSLQYVRESQAAAQKTKEEARLRLRDKIVNAETAEDYKNFERDYKGPTGLTMGNATILEDVGLRNVGRALWRGTRSCRVYESGLYKARWNGRWC